MSSSFDWEFSFSVLTRGICNNNKKQNQIDVVPTNKQNPEIITPYIECACDGGFE